MCENSECMKRIFSRKISANDIQLQLESVMD